MKKKITSTLALCIALCAAAGCAGNNAATTTAAAETASTAATAASEEAVTTAAEAEATTVVSEAPAAEGTVIYDANDIKITAAGFSASTDYSDEKLLDLNIVNNTGKPLDIYPRLCSMAGWMLDASTLTTSADGMIEMGSSFNVPAGNDTGKYALCVAENRLEEYGLTDIPNLEFMLDITVQVSDEEYRSLYSELVNINNPGYDISAPDEDASGEVMYDKDGVKILMQGEIYDKSFWGPQVKLYAFNGTDKPLFIRIPETLLDGTEYEAYGDMEIAPGRQLRETAAFGFTGDFEENMGRSMTEVPPVSEIEMTFDIYEYDAGGDNRLITTSGPCKVTVAPDSVEIFDPYGDSVQLS